MRNSYFMGYIVSLFVLIGLPIIFSILSFQTGNLKFILFSFPATLISGITGLVISRNHCVKSKLHHN